MMGYWFATILLVLGVSLGGCTGESYQEKEAKREQADKAAEAKRDAERAKAIADFSSTYNADTKWQQTLSGKRLTTLALQKSLIRQDHRPIVAEVVLLDVEKDGARYSLRLYSPDPDLMRAVRAHQHLIFDVKCSLPDFEFKLPDFIHDAVNSDYLVAIRVIEVKPAFHWEKRGQHDSLDVLETHFLVTGECLALKYIGDIEEEYDRQLSTLREEPSFQRRKR